MQTMNEQMACEDQAMGLRKMSANKPVRCVAITGGKGGVGKTNVSINLAVALAKQNQKVMLFDADLGLANVDVVLGISAEKTLEHVLSGECDIEDVVIKGPHDISIVPASSGVQKMADLNDVEQAGIISAFSDIEEQVDTLLIDTSAGIHSSVVNFSRASGEVVVVVCDEPASLTDAYALIKVLSKDVDIRRMHVLCNQVESKAHGEMLFNQLMKVVSRFLEVSLNYLGSIPEDSYVRKAVKRQLPVVDAYPRSPAAAAFTSLAKTLVQIPPSRSPSGHIEFFVERLVRATA